MTAKDTITLPREVVEKAVKALTPMAYHTPPYERGEIAEALRKALAAEQPKPEPVAWMVQNADGAFSLFSGRDEAYEYAQWAHGPRPVHPLYTAPPDAEALRREGT